MNAKALSLVAALLVSAPALAVDDAQVQEADMDRQFRGLDTNGDGVIERGEARADEGLDGLFVRADSNRSGRVNKSEYRVAQGALRNTG